jgi:pyruvate dehydrogenase E2 component (dihydrolipoamide acetyltransferase)
MATKVHMEALSPTMEEGQIVRWLKDEGDEIASGDVLAEVETDKATMELVARGAGVFRKRFLDEGQTAEVGSVIGVIAGADEDISDLVESAGPAAGGAPSEKDEAEKDEAEKDEAEKDEAEAEADAGRAADQDAVEADEGEPAEKEGRRARGDEPAPAAAAQPGEDEGDAGRVKASPLARRLADEAGLDLSEVKGTGPGGRITKGDVEAAAERGPEPTRADVEAPAAAPGARFTQPAYDGPEVEEVPVTQMRKTIAKRLATSIGPVPTFYLTVDVDMTRLVEARERINERLEAEGLKVSINDLLIKATAVALKRHPEVNAAWHQDHIKRHHRVHVGVAVAVEDGLITPVIRDADLKGAAQIGAEVRELAGRAREKKLQPDEYTGATFSISNLGMFGIEEFTAIINPPEAAILAVGKVEERVVVEDGDAMIAARMKMTMSCDHRVVDGATGARFLQTLTSLLEEPALALA